MIKIFADSTAHEDQANALAAKLKGRTEKFIAIGAGAGSADKVLAEKKNGAIAISILDPQKDHDGFDLIFLPAHEPYKTAKNIVPIIGLFNNQQAQEKGDGSVAVLVGGKHVGGNFTENDAGNLAKIINNIDTKIYITTSRRTEIAATKKLHKLTKYDAQRIFFYDYNYNADIPNPYEEMLARASVIIVTADSLRMVSESCSSGKTVYIYTPQQTHFSYVSFRDLLFKQGYALPSEHINFTAKTKLLDEAGRCADLIIHQFYA